MRRSARMSVLAALILTVPAAVTVGQSAAPGTSATPGDGDEALVVVIPEGVAPAGTIIRVEARDPSERPEELAGLPMTRPYHELLPVDVHFSAPVTVTRTLSFEELGIDEFQAGRDGLVLGSLFTRDVDGTWSWLADSEVRLDPDGAAFTVTATTDHGGPIVHAIAGDMIVATEDATATPVGEVFRVEGQLRVDPESQALIDGVTGTTSDESIARPVQSYVVEFFDRAAGLKFECLAPGTVRYETTFAVRGLADVGLLGSVTGLPATDVAVTHAGEHTCG